MFPIFRGIVSNQVEFLRTNLPSKDIDESVPSFRVISAAPLVSLFSINRLTVFIPHLQPWEWEMSYAGRYWQFIRCTVSLSGPRCIKAQAADSPYWLSRLLLFSSWVCLIWQKRKKMKQLIKYDQDITGWWVYIHPLIHMIRDAVPCNITTPQIPPLLHPRLSILA